MVLPRPASRHSPITSPLIGLGLAGTVALAAAGYLAGALPSGDPGPGFRTGGPGAVPHAFLIGLSCWLIGLSAVSFAWWRLLAGHFRSSRQVLWTGALWAAPLLVAPALGSRDVFAYACQGWLWSNGLDPYAIGVADGGCPWSQAVPQLWWSTSAPYGPLALLLSGLAAAAGTALSGLFATSGLLRLLALLAVVLLAVALPRLAAACRVPAADALALGLVTPLLLVHGLSGAHHDMIVTALMVASLAVALGRRVVVFTAMAGVLLAAAVAVKVTALLAAPFLLILTGRRWPASVVAAVLTFGGLTALTGLDLGWIGALSDTGSLVQWSSVPTAVGMAAGYLLRLAGRDDWVEAAVAVARASGLLVLAVIAVRQLLAAWRGRTEPATVVRAGGIVLAAAALLGPVFYPWYALAPLAVLAASTGAPGQRRILAVATVVCAALVLPNGLGLPVLTKAVGAFAVTIALIALVVRTRPRVRA